MSDLVGDLQTLIAAIVSESGVDFWEETELVPKIAERVASAFQQVGRQHFHDGVGEYIQAMDDPMFTAEEWADLEMRGAYRPVWLFVPDLKETP